MLFNLVICIFQGTLWHQALPNLPSASRQNLWLQDSVHNDPTSLLTAPQRRQTDVLCCKFSTYVYNRLYFDLEGPFSFCNFKWAQRKSLIETPPSFAIEWICSYIPTQIPEENLSDYLQSPGLIPNFPVIWFLIWWLPSIRVHTWYWCVLTEKRCRQTTHTNSHRSPFSKTFETLDRFFK